MHAGVLFPLVWNEQKARGTVQEINRKLYNGNVGLRGPVQFAEWH